MRFLIPMLLVVLAVQPASAANPIADSANHFGLDLYSRLLTERGLAGGIVRLRSMNSNVFFSPYSIDTALLMVQAGAAGKTAQEIHDVLHLPDMPAAQLHKAAGELIASLQADLAGKGYELHVANSLWMQKNFALLPAYTDLLQSRYLAAANQIDFTDANPRVAKTINDWVAGKTHDRIKNLIDPGMLSSDTRVALINAIYFKGDWQSPFNIKLTRDAPWHIDEGDAAVRKPAEMMHQTGRFLFFQDDHLSALQLPYKGKQLAMLVLLPRKGKLADLEAGLNLDSLNQIIGNLRPGEVAVSFPKFSLHDHMALGPLLDRMGLKEAFTSAADFSGMDGRRDLEISHVIHAAFVQVDETGTEAAGASGVTIKATAVRAAQQFNVDHPFLLLIRDLNSDAILFIGRVSDPTAK